jgi:TonB family protein
MDKQAQDGYSLEIMRYFRTLTISLALHFIVALAVAWLQPTPHIKTKSASFVELLEKPELPDRPHQPPKDMKHFVRSVDVPEAMLAKEKKPARFASDQDRTVLEETRARKTDLTTNRKSEASPTTEAATQPAATKGSTNGATKKMAAVLDIRPRSALERIREEFQERTSAGDIEVAKRAPETAPQLNESRKPIRQAKVGSALQTLGLQPGISSFGEATPDDVKFGDMTALNTDRHLFYTFYARMEEMIRYRWINYARAAMFSLAADPRKATGKDVWETRLEVLLDPQGHYIRSILHESSGIKSLDTAPAQAFREAHQFPNPPPEMVKQDGMIHVYYTFTVNGMPDHVANRN